MDQVATVVPVFNRSDPVVQLIGHLSHREQLVDHVVVVDHGDAPVSLPSPARPTVHRIRKSPDLWFTAAMNTGLRYVLAELQQVDTIVLANDDVEFVNAETIDSLVLKVRANQRTIWASPAARPNGRLLYSAIRIRPLTATYTMLERGKNYRYVVAEPLSSDVLPTRLLACPRSALEMVGFLDEWHLPQYGSDYEWSARARRRGYSLMIAREVPILTEPNLATELRGLRPYQPPFSKTFNLRVRSLVQVGSIRSEFEMARLIHRAPLSIHWFLVNALRATAGLVLGILRYVFSR